MELINNELMDILKKYPKFEISYETVSQKGDLSKYEVCIAVPIGKKVFIWNIYNDKNDIVYLLESNKNKQVYKATVLQEEEKIPLCQNTLLYGTLIESEQPNDPTYFTIEDIYYYNNIYLKSVPFKNKLHFMKEYINKMGIINNSFIYYTMPYIWSFKYSNNLKELPFVIDNEIQSNIGYTVHHLQYRSLNSIVPYINVQINRKININNVPNQINTSYFIPKYTNDYNKPQYRYNAYFKVKADYQNDIYHLYAYGKKSLVYYGILFVPDYNTSVNMNNIFRNIKENKNIDYIEESEDEEEFQNVSMNKYVDTNKIVVLECKFNRKFKKWYPVNNNSINTNTIVHISKLVSDYTQ